MSKKSKKAELKVRKTLKKEVAVKLDSLISEIALGLKIDSKKTSKIIAKSSKQLAEKLSAKINVSLFLKPEKPIDSAVSSEEESSAPQKKATVKAKPASRRVAPVKKATTKTTPVAEPVNVSTAEVAAEVEEVPQMAESH